ncbi:MAG TPA: hypothetical protein VGB55_03910, partial [Tepidisphaeraceae bacterium]
MPPPIQQQSGSRAALITWTVITSILFVVATVLAIFANVDRNKRMQELDTLKSRYDKVISEADLSGDVSARLNDVKTANPGYKDLRQINVAIAQRDNLIRTIAGPAAASEADAIAAANAALGQAKALAEKAKITQINADSLNGAVTSLTSTVNSQQTDIAQLTSARDALNKQIDGLKATFTQQLAAKDKDIEAARAQAEAFQNEVTSERSIKEKQLTDITSGAEQTAQLAQEDVNRLQAREQELQGKIKQEEAVRRALQNKLRDVRQPVDQVARQADARIIRTTSNGYVFIDLGTGDQVVPGMSFEVYDRIEGMPKPGDATNDENLPKGKASIEIIRVTPGSSECRIIRSTPGQNVVDGDLCVNIVYDRNVKY